MEMEEITMTEIQVTKSESEENLNKETLEVPEPKYLKIQNSSVLPLALLFMLGASTKKEDASKFGEFGTGLKYSIAYFARTGIKLRMFLGKKEITYAVHPKTVRKRVFNLIYINNRSTGYTTEYGSGWKAWEVVREIWCNAIDETNITKEVVTKDQIEGTARHTTFFLELQKPLQDVVDNWEDHFLETATPLYTSFSLDIYQSTGSLRLYKNKVLIHSAGKDAPRSLFYYDIKDAPLNELREYRGWTEYDIVKAVTQSSEKIAGMLVQAFHSYYEGTESNSEQQSKYDFHERSLDYAFYSSYISKEKIYENFKGKLYVSRDSSRGIKHGAKVSKGLLKLLGKCGLKTSDLLSYGGYGGGGYASRIEYEVLPNPRLEEKINQILKKYSLSLNFNVMIPIDGKDVDVALASESTVSFNTRLETVDTRELASIVLTGLVLAREKSYIVLKRLIKTTLSNNKKLKAVLEL
ncbi:hypothetical protein LCGC14_0246060 [marine sediment metagenome]|uniref:Uncharacterized protein n=1 Tax=marine sediment metagenome TaxID=412755 RepID=A0A0F9U666_9ZZZZ